MDATRFEDSGGVAVNRWGDAVFIQQGACNPSGVARALVRAINACLDVEMDTAAICADPAVRLIGHQLAFLLKVDEIDQGRAVYGDLLSACEAQQQAVSGVAL
jgi:hypothetical protein